MLEEFSLHTHTHTFKFKHCCFGSIINGHLLEIFTSFACCFPREQRTDSPLSFTHLEWFRTKTFGCWFSIENVIFPLAIVYVLKQWENTPHLLELHLFFSCPGLPTILFNAPRGRSVRATQLLHGFLPFSEAWKTTQGFQWGEVRMTPYNLVSFLMISQYRVEVFLHGGTLSVHNLSSTLPSCPCHCEWSL